VFLHRERWCGTADRCYLAGNEPPLPAVPCRAWNHRPHR